mmetsp:Transcript_14613/g.27478  ORF Transcript_14613/g.27478 Transcript_14613/m.27478 type:complete len:658 (-) Transcript_14613:42-2015(-)|eukprot:CAMPEP_0176496432 /NCGR_PEP_ID=MMETSP0200_2-20121128/11188_1 /TAXON_ID=947934 /ORGANISM="Chaetoceros sp., Strain GSL56" /LENGTH=657 /DNA_ID=CAMNT_0017894379 /DNA_START=136 /DNA_END=2109 /DNA_ORIENTATION=-
MKHVEFTAVILASTCGARLYPLTSSTTSSSSSTCNATTANGAESMPVETQTTTTTTSSSSALEGDTINNSHETFMPKHLLPLAGRPIIFHLVEHCEGIGMEQIIIAIGSEDHKLGMTQRALLSYLVGCHRVDNSVSTGAATAGSGNVDELQYGKARIAIVPLPADCGGSADALRHVVSANVIKSSLSGKNHVMVLPSDLVLYGHVGKRNIEKDNEQQQQQQRQRDGANASGIGSMAAACKEIAPESTVDSLLYWNALGSLANVHRREYRAGLKKGMPLAMTLLLADVGEEDENGLPLKESAKAKKGGIARDEEDIEYIGISTIRNRNQPPTQRIIVKQSKYNVEEDIHNTGATPKLHIPKARLHSPMNQIMIKSSWSDLHVFCFSPWALNLLLVKDHLKELGKDFVPFLVSRQFRGLRASFGSGGGGGVKGGGDDIVMAQIGEEKTLDALLVDTMEELNLDGKRIKRKRGSMIFHVVDDNVMREGRGGGVSVDENSYEGDCPFMVSAHVLSRECSKLSLRACTIPSYMYACREVVTRAIASSAVTTNQTKNEFGALYLPEGTTIDDKFNCVVLPDTVIGEKVQIKSCTIGRGVSIGNRCRLNNVVVHDNAVIGENSILQNSTLSEGSIIGMNCNLNECQIGIRAEVPVGTKAKGEGF